MSFDVNYNLNEITIIHFNHENYRIDDALRLKLSLYYHRETIAITINLDLTCNSDTSTLPF
jgi:hypothetical protein